MIRVANQRCIRMLSQKSLRLSLARNGVVIIAIILTTLLFTSLFTIMASLGEAVQDNMFRQVGGKQHAGFKFVNETEVEILKDDPLIKAYGLRRIVGMPREAPFHKSHVEVSWSDRNQAQWMYCEPTIGRLPAENTQEAATDTRILDLLGITPEVGAPFTLRFDVDGVETTQSFILSGWWPYDEAMVANHVLIPESRVEAIFAELGTEGRDGMTTLWDLSVMFHHDTRIEPKIEQILTNHGYQSHSPGEDNYIATGINWGYNSARLAKQMDLVTAVAIGVVLFVIGLTGYLIINNVFRLSLTHDIRYYGLLKTIGTTPRQLRKIIYYQALFLSVVGIPLGLLAGWLFGSRLTPLVIGQLQGMTPDVIALNPWIFIFSGFFAAMTVLLSCLRPMRLAGRVSPVDAVRYVEGQDMKRRRKSGKVTPLAMAWANLRRHPRKTVLTLLSLTLAVLLMNLTVTFTAGFDMDKYLNKVVADFVLADARYFRTTGTLFDEGMALPIETIDTLGQQKGVTTLGKVYGKTGVVQEFVEEKDFRISHGQRQDEAEIERIITTQTRHTDDRLVVSAQLYGMDEGVLQKITTNTGDLALLGQDTIAAVYTMDDYGRVKSGSHWAEVDDLVTLQYADAYTYVDPETGAPVDPNSGANYVTNVIGAREKTYRVVATVAIPHSLSYRYYGEDAFLLDADTFIQDTGTDQVMLAALDVTDEANPDMETYLSHFTRNEQSQYDYESRATYQSEFEGFRTMFLILGGALSFVVGLVGILNFFNVIFTGIHSRRREFAVMQAIGMTNKQLQLILAYEGLFYAVCTVGLSLLLSLAVFPIFVGALSQWLWFFSFRFLLSPVLIVVVSLIVLGCTIPLVIYRIKGQPNVIERLRQIG